MRVLWNDHQKVWIVALHSLSCSQRSIPNHPLNILVGCKFIHTMLLIELNAMLSNCLMKCLLNICNKDEAQAHYFGKWWCLPRISHIFHMDGEHLESQPFQTYSHQCFVIRWKASRHLIMGFDVLEKMCNGLYLHSYSRTDFEAITSLSKMPYPSCDVMVLIFYLCNQRLFSSWINIVEVN